MIHNHEKFNYKITSIIDIVRYFNIRKFHHTIVTVENLVSTGISVNDKNEKLKYIAKSVENITDNVDQSITNPLYAWNLNKVRWITALTKTQLLTVHVPTQLLKVYLYKPRLINTCSDTIANDILLIITVNKVLSQKQSNKLTLWIKKLLTIHWYNYIKIIFFFFLKWNKKHVKSTIIYV